MMRLPFEEIQQELRRILLTRDCPAEKAEMVSYEMTRNSLEGVYTHGVNRFIRLINNIDDGIVRVDVMPKQVNAFGALANYDGQMGLGIVNATFAMDKCIELARGAGIGMVALRNTNHWLRAATYAYQACAAGMAAICFCNTTPNMPTWGAEDARLGNYPIALSFPRAGGNIVADVGALPGDEHCVSQVFIAINMEEIAPTQQTDAIQDRAVAYLLGSSPVSSGDRISWPGQRAVETRARNLAEGIPVDERVWEQIRRLG